MKKVLHILAISVFCSAPLTGQAGTIMDFVRPGVTVGPVSFPLYKQPDSKLTAVVHVEKAHLAYQREGFFRIGIMPVCALEGVTFEFQDTESAAATFQQVQQWLGVGDGRRVEMRRVKFLSSTNTLEAGRVNCRNGDQWELLDGVRLVCGGKETRGQRAMLQISGDNAGRVILEDNSEGAGNFLAPMSPPQR